MKKNAIILIFFTNFLKTALPSLTSSEETMQKEEWKQYKAKWRQHSDDLTLDILQTSITSDNPNLFENILNQIELTDSQITSLRKRLDGIKNQDQFIAVLNYKLGSKTPNPKPN